MFALSKVHFKNMHWIIAVVVRYQVSRSLMLQAQSDMVTKYRNAKKEICISRSNSSFYCRHIILVQKFCRNFSDKYGDLSCFLAIEDKEKSCPRVVLECQGSQEIVKNVGRSSELPLIIPSEKSNYCDLRRAQVGAQLLMKTLSRCGRLWNISVLEAGLWIKDGLY